MNLHLGVIVIAAMVTAAAPAQAGFVIIHQLIDPLNPTFTQALGINNGGTVVGYGNANAFNGIVVTSPYNGGAVTNQNVPGSSGTQVVGVSSGGTTVGFWVDAGGGNFGFTQTGGVFSTVVAPGTQFNQLLGINSLGTMAAGYSSLDYLGATQQRAMVVAGGPAFSTPTFTYIDGLLPSNVNSQATGINDTGNVVGFYQTAGGNFIGFLDVAGIISSIQAPGAVSTQALGTNNLGDIVGDYVDSVGVMHGFIDRGGLFSTIDFAGSTATVVNGINDLGQAVGFYTDAVQNTFGFVGTQSQVPEPGSWALALMALASLGLSTRSKHRT